MSLSETWLHKHLDAELSVEGYTLFRSDRIVSKKKSKGRFSGGVALYVRDDVATNAETLLKFSNGVLEILGVYIKVLNLVVYSVYRSPDDSDHNEVLLHMNSIVV